MMALQRGGRMFCKNYVGAVFSFLFVFFVSFLARLSSCFPIFINFPALLFSPVRWSLIVVVEGFQAEGQMGQDK